MYVYILVVTRDFKQFFPIFILGNIIFLLTTIWVEPTTQ